MAAEESKEKRTLAVAAEDDAVSGKQQKKARGGGDVESVTEAEVDEFFAILRRIHVAISYFKKNNDRRIKEEEGSRFKRISVAWSVLAKTRFKDAPVSTNALRIWTSLIRAVTYKGLL